MGISPQAISRLLRRLWVIRPDLFSIYKEHTTPRRNITLGETEGYSIKYRF